jgi:hypothetical protein
VSHIKQKGVTIMGYYKQKEISDQERVDDIVRWWKSHEGQPIPLYLLQAVVSDQDFFSEVLEQWEGHIDTVMGRGRMTRKESDAILRERNRRAFWTMTWTESRFVMIALFVSLIGNIAALITLVAVTS